MSDDVVRRFCAATEAADVDAVMETLASDAELISPLIARATFRGHRDLRVLFDILLPVLAGLTWRHQVGGGSPTVALSSARVMGVRIDEAMVLEVDPDGRIHRMTPHIRPWLGSTLLALRLGPRLARHPAVIRRALRRS